MRALKRATLGAATVLLLAYGTFCVAAWAILPRLLFPTDMIERPIPDGPPRDGIERWWITAGDGSRVEAWFIPAPGASIDRPAPAVMFFHGNGELIDYNLRFAELYASMGVSTLLPEYRGYGRSGGRPSEAAITEDMRAFRAQLGKDTRVDASRIAYHGRSLGGGVAAALASIEPPRALVLESTFSSMCAMVNTFGLPGLVCSSPFRTDLVLPGLERPVLVLHGLEDHAVPAWHGRRLHELAPGSEFFQAAGGHNDFPVDREAYDEALLGFMRRTVVFDGHAVEHRTR